MRTLAILPIKNFSEAKQRLAHGLSPARRETLAEAMFRDVLAALGQTSAIDELLVVTAGSAPRRLAQEHGATVLAEEEPGHNAAARLGIRAALDAAAGRVLLVPGDCPALDPAELDALLARPVEPPAVVIVPDRHGTGTNALMLTPPDALEPSFGPGSCQRHADHARAAGVHCEVVEVASLAMDVDTPADLDALEAALAPTTSAAALPAASGSARHTRELLGKLTPSTKC
jgi:2-phospho-L-lactate guanylyltransferase